MIPYQLTLLHHFFSDERTLSGEAVDWAAYDFLTMQELDRLRTELNSPCRLIRGGHGALKETAVDAVFPDAPFSQVAMALMRSGFSKGLYQGGSIHLDNRMGPTGLARCWLAFKENLETRASLRNLGFQPLRQETANGWDYYAWRHLRAWELLQLLVKWNETSGGRR